MNIVREHINERMGFTEDSDPIKDMGIGMPFGFSSKMLGLEANDGKHSIYVKPEFIEKICTPDKGAGARWLKQEFKARYGDRTYYKDKSKWSKLQFSCSFGFNRYRDGDVLLYRVYGSSGTHGFFGGAMTKKENLAPVHVKHCLEDLYLHLEKLL
jgi:hypothetical protein